MKGICKGLIVMALIFLISPVAEAQFFTGATLMDEWKAFQRANAGQLQPSDTITDAIKNGHYMGFVMGVWNTANYYYVTPGGITGAQMFHVVGKYLEEHPQRWHESAVILVVDALNQAFPQFPTKKK